MNTRLNCSTSSYLWYRSFLDRESNTLAYYNDFIDNIILPIRCFTEWLMNFMDHDHDYNNIMSILKYIRHICTVHIYFAEITQLSVYLKS